ncbi:hypothetical protein BLNAU_6714 [Blattamonas nauphoetae]|uniref:Uncharacterized protein n=1 Tax=Blattamonas nauphoetae TaxID=2049346 RepID=A0ABQ9Y3B5_9EUKA|nr:hypothetical protein BLNAU_6714 [Blattamonas nauphoetae]
MDMRISDPDRPKKTHFDFTLMQISPLIRSPIIKNLQDKKNPLSFLTQGIDPSPQPIFPQHILTDILTKLKSLQPKIHSDTENQQIAVMSVDPTVVMFGHGSALSLDSTDQENSIQTVPMFPKTEDKPSSNESTHQNALLLFLSILGVQDNFSHVMKAVAIVSGSPTAWSLPKYSDLASMFGKFYHSVASDPNGLPQTNIVHEFISVICHIAAAIKVEPPPRAGQDLMTKLMNFTLTDEYRSSLVNSAIVIQKLLEEMGANVKRRIAKIPVQKVTKPVSEKAEHSEWKKDAQKFQSKLDPHCATMQHSIAVEECHQQVVKEANVEEERKDEVEVVYLSILQYHNPDDSTHDFPTTEIPLINPDRFITTPQKGPTVVEMASSLLPHPKTLEMEASLEGDSIYELMSTAEDVSDLLARIEGLLNTIQSTKTTQVTVPIPLRTNMLTSTRESSFDMFMLAGYHMLVCVFLIGDDLIPEALSAATNAAKNIHQCVLEDGLLCFMNRGLGIRPMMIIYQLLLTLFVPCPIKDADCGEVSSNIGDTESSTRIWRYVEDNRNMFSGRHKMDPIIALFVHQQSNQQVRPQTQTLNTASSKPSKISSKLLLTLPRQIIAGCIASLILLTNTINMLDVISPSLGFDLKSSILLFQCMTNMLKSSSPQEEETMEKDDKTEAQERREEVQDKIRSNEPDSDGFSEGVVSFEHSPVFVEARAEYEAQLAVVVDVLKEYPTILQRLFEVQKNLEQFTPSKVDGRALISERLVQFSIPNEQVLSETDLIVAELTPIDPDLFNKTSIRTYLTEFEENFLKRKRMKPTASLSRSHQKKESKMKVPTASLVSTLGSLPNQSGIQIGSLPPFVFPPRATLPFMSSAPIPPLIPPNTFTFTPPVLPRLNPVPATPLHAVPDEPEPATPPMSHSSSSLTDSPFFFSTSPNSSELSSPFGFFSSPQFQSSYLDSPSFTGQDTYASASGAFPFSFITQYDPRSTLPFQSEAVLADFNQVGSTQSVASPEFQLQSRPIGRIEKDGDLWE